MSLRYVDRSGRPLDRDTWRALFDQERHRVIERVVNLRLRLELAWVGVWLPSREPKARPFLVDVTPLTTSSGTVVIPSRKALPPPRFFETEALARLVYERLKLELFRK